MTTVQELDLETDVGNEGIFLLVGHHDDIDRMYLVKDILFCKRNVLPCGLLSAHPTDGKLNQLFPEKFTHTSPLSSDQLVAIGDRQKMVMGKLPPADCQLVLVMEMAENEPVDALADVPHLLTIACICPVRLDQYPTKHRGTFLLKHSLRHLTHDDKTKLQSALAPQAESVERLENMLAQLKDDTSCLFFGASGDMAYYDADVRENFQFGAPAFRVVSA